MFNEIDGVQTTIMLFIKDWCITQKTPIPRKLIVQQMIAKGNIESTTIHALSSLVGKGFIRRAYSDKRNQTSYVMIRTI